MNRSDWLTDDQIEAAFERRAGRAAPIELRDEIVALTAVTGQRASWRLRLGSTRLTPALRPAWVGLLVLGVILAAALALVLVGAPTTRDLLTQQVTEPSDVDGIETPQESHGPQAAHRGLIAYTQDGDVYLANPDGSGAIMVVHDVGVPFRAPIWSPDARWLAIQGGEGTFLLDAGTLALRHIAAGSGAVWSPDSQSLAFVSSSAGESGAIEIMNAQTGALRELRPPLGAGTSLAPTLAWSPDGRWFLAPTNASDGKRFVRIDAATGETVDIAPMYHLADPGAHWSPDSRRFVYARPEDCGSNPPCPSSVVVEDADLTNAVAITDPTKLASMPTWSPDGTWIAFGSSTLGPVSPRGGPTPSSPTVSIVRPDGRDLRALVDLTGYYGTGFTWSADGGAVDYAEVDPSTALVLGVSEVRIRDGTKRSIVRAPGLDGYDWQAVAAELTVPSLPSAPASTSSAQASAVPPSSPRAASPADPSGSWSGLAIDSHCDAGWLDFRTLTQRYVGPRCQKSNGAVVAAPLGTAFAVPKPDGTVTVVRRDGSSTKGLGAIGPLQQDTFRELDVAWSPDGGWLSVPACLQGQPADCPQFLVISPDGRSQRSLPASPSWSPDGRRLVVQATGGDLLIGSPDGSDLHSIGTLPMPVSWSPDANRFAFIRDGDAWIANADGSGQRNVTGFAAGGVYGAAWSPDGRFLAVTQETQLWILALDGGDVRPIDLGPGRSSFYGPPIWSPDGARLAVVVWSGEKPLTLIVAADDWTTTALSGTGLPVLTWSPDGQFLALLDLLTTPAKIDIANSDGSGLHTIWTGSDESSRLTWYP